MPKNKERSLKSHLVVLIMHVIKWHSQPWARSQSWINSIKNARNAIAKILADHPSLLRMVDKLIPEACLIAIRDAEDEIGFPPTFTNPSKEDLFDKGYNLDDPE